MGLSSPSDKSYSFKLEVTFFPRHLMALSFLRQLSRYGLSWKPLQFTNSNFTRIPASQKIEEETIPDYVASRYYPTRIGEIFEKRYQVIGKLGYGATSTVWLARDML